MTHRSLSDQKGRHQTSAMKVHIRMKSAVPGFKANCVLFNTDIIVWLCNAY